jgi:hypothetical protein
MKTAIGLIAASLVAAPPALLCAPDPPVSHAGCAAPGDPVDPALLERPVTLKRDVGKVHQKVTTSSPDAQAFYDQGLTLLHHYVFIEAARVGRGTLSPRADRRRRRGEDEIDRPGLPPSSVSTARQAAR